MQPATMIDAITMALDWEMSRDRDVVVLGQDAAANGGFFGATSGLRERFGTDRVRDTPLAEGMIVGLCVGMAAQGLRPVAEIPFMGFIFPALDQIVNHLSRMRSRTQGRLSCPVVIRVPHGGGTGAPEHHSECMEALLAHVAGLRVVCPSSPSRAYGLLLASVRDPDPVIFLEPRRSYRAERQEIKNDGRTVPLDACHLVRPGSDVTLVSWGAMISETVMAAEYLATENLSAEVVDLSSISPIDRGTILKSVEKTGRLVIVHEAAGNCGVGAEIAAIAAEDGWTALKAPVRRVTGYDTIVPLARLEHSYIPSVDRIIDAVRTTLKTG